MQLFLAVLNETPAFLSGVAQTSFDQIEQQWEQGELQRQRGGPRAAAGSSAGPTLGCGGLLGVISAGFERTPDGSRFQGTVS